MFGLGAKPPIFLNSLCQLKKKISFFLVKSIFNLIL